MKVHMPLGVLAVTLAIVLNTELRAQPPDCCGKRMGGAAEETTKPATQPAALTEPQFQPGRHRQGRRGGDAPAMRGTGGPRGGGMMRGAMGLIHSLLDQRQKVRRAVEEIPGGVMTLTTSDDKEVTAALRQHVRQMKDRFAAGQPIRMWDPLYVELFAYRDKIKLDVQDVAGGVSVQHTSDDPKVTALIRQHSGAVSEFLAKGYDRVHQPTTLPAGYTATRPAER